MRHTLDLIRLTFFSRDSSKYRDSSSSPLRSMSRMNKMRRRAVLVTPAMMMSRVTTRPKMLVGTISP